MSDIGYLELLLYSRPPPLRVLASDKGQGGETVSDVTLPEDQTPFFPSDVDYVRGDTALLHWLEAALEHGPGSGQDLLRAALALTPFQLHPHEEALGHG